MFASARCSSEPPAGRSGSASMSSPNCCTLCQLYMTVSRTMVPSSARRRAGECSSEPAAPWWCAGPPMLPTAASTPGLLLEFLLLVHLPLGAGATGEPGGGKTAARRRQAAVRGRRQAPTAACSAELRRRLRQPPLLLDRPAKQQQSPGSGQAAPGGQQRRAELKTAPSGLTAKHTASVALTRYRYNAPAAAGARPGTSPTLLGPLVAASAWAVAAQMIAVVTCRPLGDGRKGPAAEQASVSTAASPAWAPRAGPWPVQITCTWHRTSRTSRRCPEARRAAGSRGARPPRPP